LTSCKIKALLLRLCCAPNSTGCNRETEERAKRQRTGKGTHKFASVVGKCIKEGKGMILVVKATYKEMKWICLISQRLSECGITSVCMCEISSKPADISEQSVENI
jgi:hypothetical protein